MSNIFISKYRIMICVPLVLLFVGSWAAPADNPIRVDLPVYDKPGATAAVVPFTKPLESENHPGIDQSTQGNFVSYKLQAASNLLGSKLHSNSLEVNHHGTSGIFSPITTLESAVQETEGYGSKTLSIKENFHHIAAGLFQPKPLVDTITEEEKYGNTGEKFEAAGRAVVGGAQGVSNFVNSVLEVPASIFKKITKAVSEKLNNLGGKLVGL